MKTENDISKQNYPENLMFSYNVPIFYQKYFPNSSEKNIAKNTVAFA